jgi:hypothetical protein
VPDRVTQAAPELSAGWMGGPAGGRGDRRVSAA